MPSPGLPAARAHTSTPAQADRHDHPLGAERDPDADAPGHGSFRLNAVVTRTSVLLGLLLDLTSQQPSAGVGGASLAICATSARFLRAGERPATARRTRPFRPPHSHQTARRPRNCEYRADDCDGDDCGGRPAPHAGLLTNRLMPGQHRHTLRPRDASCYGSGSSPFAARPADRLTRLSARYGRAMPEVGSSPPRASHGPRACRSSAPTPRTSPARAARTRSAPARARTSESAKPTRRTVASPSTSSADPGDPDADSEPPGRVLDRETVRRLLERLHVRGGQRRKCADGLRAMPPA